MTSSSAGLDFTQKRPCSSITDSLCVARLFSVPPDCTKDKSELQVADSTIAVLIYLEGCQSKSATSAVYYPMVG